MKNLLKMTSLIFILAANLMSAAHSQESSQVDAKASLMTATAALTLSGQNELSFFQLNIPNGTETGHQCAYNMSVSGAQPSFSLQELTETGSVADSSAPTPSGCDWGTQVTPTGSYGLFQVSCNPSSEVEFAAGWATGTDGAVFLSQPTSTPLRAFTSADLSSALASGTSTATMSTACPTNGSMFVAVGGRVVVGESATPGTDVTLGQIELYANY